MTAVNPVPGPSAATSPTDLTDWALAWPREVFRTVAIEVLADAGADDVVELLVREAFVDGDRLAGKVESGSWRYDLPSEWVQNPLPLDKDLLRALVGHVDQLPVEGERPLWTERTTGTAVPKLTVATVRRQFVGIVDDLYGRGYFEASMPQGCVDEQGGDVDPDDVLARRLGRSGLWPLQTDDNAFSTSPWGEGTLFDLIELFHDLVARPRSRGRWHNWNNCGWHYADFDRRTGRVIYRSLVNELLDRSDLPYRLADAGKDRGRLVAITDDDRDDLVDAMVARTDPGTGDRVRYAIAQFRARGAIEHDKRGAIIMLAGVLEERKRLLQTALFSKDENDLFMVANKFAIRHQSASQQADYDPFFLDWVFWWYLATIELSDRLLARQAGPPADPGA